MVLRRRERCLACLLTTSWVPPQARFAEVPVPLARVAQTFSLAAGQLILATQLRGGRLSPGLGLGDYIPRQ